MKLPRKPPSEPELLAGLAPEVLTGIWTHVPDPLVNGKYLHWDKVRHRTPPGGLSHREWWFGLKLRRRALAKPVPLNDKFGTNFTYSLIDPLHESLHLIDSHMHGGVQLPEQVTSPETKDHYIVKSLIEEAITSSQIEGASTTRDVAKEMIRRGRPPANRSERMIYNNYLTMRMIRDLKDERLTEGLVFEIHRRVTEGTLDDPTAAGRFRRADERILLADEYGEVFHIPPAADGLAGRMTSMCDFANGDPPRPYLHPAIRSMVLHFWLAYDHPFVDGNGRTARALFYWSMLRQGYWLFEFVSISRAILRSYIQYLRAFLHTESDENDLTYFLVYHAKVIRDSISFLREYIDEKSRRLARVQAELRGMVALNHRQRELILHALKHPGFSYTYESHRASHGVVHQTARTDLLGLAAKGLLLKRKVGKVWFFTPAADLEAKLENPA